MTYEVLVTVLTMCNLKRENESVWCDFRSGSVTLVKKGSGMINVPPADWRPVDCTVIKKSIASAKRTNGGGTK